MLTISASTTLLVLAFVLLFDTFVVSIASAVGEDVASFDLRWYEYSYSACPALRDRPPSQYLPWLQHL